MNFSIPNLKKCEFLGGYIPASFSFINDDGNYKTAAKVFEQYAVKRFGNVSKYVSNIRVIEDCSLREGYFISVKDEIVITVGNVVGINHAFATLLQLAEIKDGKIVFPKVLIEDYPDSEWRGISQDLARCYHEIEYLYAIADLCWLLKINRLQLHLTDDQAVRFPFSKLPNAVDEEHYTKEQLKDFDDYCFERGITVVPEIDAPGHSRAFNLAYPDLFGPPPCTAEQQMLPEFCMYTGIIQAEERTFDLLKDMYTEVAKVFPNSPYIHIGGDEAKLVLWDLHKPTVEYKEKHNLKDNRELYGHFVARICNIILEIGRIPVVWEGFPKECNHMIPKETVVFSWESLYQLAPELLSGGFKIINASWKPLYLVNPKFKWDADVILDWEKNVWTHWWDASPAYKEPIVVSKSSPVLGGQLCVWGDCMQKARAYDKRHTMIKDEFDEILLRLPALAEKTWNSYGNPDKENFKEAYDKLSCLYNSII